MTQPGNATKLNEDGMEEGERNETLIVMNGDTWAKLGASKKGRCPRVSESLTGSVDLQLLNDTGAWFEVYRIQTYNAPAYVEGISCSVMELAFASPGNDSVINATMKVSWETGLPFRRHRQFFTGKIALWFTARRKRQA